MLRYAAAAVTSLVLITGLSACGAGDPPAAQPKPTRTATTPSASPSPTPPAMPAAARANTKAGAQAFVRHYIALVNYAQATGDTTVMRPLESQRCISCGRARRYLHRIYDHGGHISGGQWHVKRLDALRVSSGSAWTVDVFGQFEPSKTFSTTGAAPVVAHGGKAPATFFVKHTTRRWKVVRWTRGI